MDTPDIKNLALLGEPDSDSEEETPNFFEKGEEDISNMSGLGVN